MPQLRINLLPAYFAERRKTQSAIVLASLLFAAALILPLVWFALLKPKVEQREQEANDMEQRAQQVTAYKAETQRIRDQVKPILDKVEFVEGVRFYNGWVQKIYRRAAQYTIKDVEYSAMNVQGNTLTISAYADDASDLGRYLITFFGNPDVSAVSVSGPPGWQQPGQAGQAGGGGVPGAGGDPTFQNFGQPQRPRTGFPFTVTATLIQAVRAPQLPASLNESTAGAPGAVPGMPMGMDPGMAGGMDPGMAGPPPDAGAPAGDAPPADAAGEDE